MDVGYNLWFLLWKLEEDDLLTFFDGIDEDSNILEKLSGNYGTFGISTMGNSLFIKFETGDTFGSSTWRGFHATIYYGTYKNIYVLLLCYDLKLLKQIPTCDIHACG